VSTLVLSQNGCRLRRVLADNSNFTKSIGHERLNLLGECNVAAVPVEVASSDSKAARPLA
jgi:hypothetical protein